MTEWLNLALASVATPRAALLHLERALEGGVDPSTIDGALAALPGASELLSAYAGAPLVGYVEIQSQSALRLWRRRWAVRRGAQLLLFASHDAPASATPLASVDLTQVAQLTRTPREPLRFDLLLRSGLAHRWRAATRAEADRWVLALSDLLSALLRRTATRRATAAAAAESSVSPPPVIALQSQLEQQQQAEPPLQLLVDVSLLRALCDEVDGLRAQLAALQRQVAAARDTRAELMRAREQLDDLTSTINELSQHEPPPAATERERRQLHAMSVLAQVDQLAVAARQKKLPPLPVRGTLYGEMTDDDDLCMRCNALPATMLVTVDDRLPERLCDRCTDAVQREAEQINNRKTLCEQIVHE